MTLSLEEQKHYNRHLILEEIGESGQLKLKQTKVLVIGAGGLGCPILQYLAGAGVGTIGIIDDDIIDISNLHRQILYSYEDIGKFKAQVAAAKLSRLNPFIKFEMHLNKVTPKNAVQMFSKYDIIVDGTDNFPTRYLVNDAAVLTDKPLVFGSIYKFDGQVSVFNYKNGPTYRCLYPKPPSSGQGMNCSDIGVLGVLPGIIGSLQANEVLKIILGLGHVLSGRLLTFDALSLKQRILNFERNPAGHIEELEEDYEHFCDISEIDYKNYEAHKSDFNVLDVRTLYEREQYAIESIHIPLDVLIKRIDEIPKDKTLLVYCKTGIRSRIALQSLRENGCQIRMVSLRGGLGSALTI